MSWSERSYLSCISVTPARSAIPSAHPGDHAVDPGSSFLFEFIRFGASEFGSIDIRNVFDRLRGLTSRPNVLESNSQLRPHSRLASSQECAAQVAGCWHAAQPNTSRQAVRGVRTSERHRWRSERGPAKSGVDRVRRPSHLTWSKRKSFQIRWGSQNAQLRHAVLRQWTVVGAAPRTLQQSGRQASGRRNGIWTAVGYLRRHSGQDNRLELGDHLLGVGSSLVLSARRLPWTRWPSVTIMSPFVGIHAQPGDPSTTDEPYSGTVVAMSTDR